MIATRDTALYSAIGNPGGFVPPNLKGLAKRGVGSPEAGMLSAAAERLTSATLPLAFGATSTQSAGSIDSAAPLGKKPPSRSSH